MEKESIDLMNVDYEDVLHLYKGWKKSEGTVLEKNKEIMGLKSKVKALQEATLKYRNQLNALELLKESIVSLEKNLVISQQENKHLIQENKELAALNNEAEQILHEKVQHEKTQQNKYKEIQLELATLKGRYEESTKLQKEYENLASEEQMTRMSTETRLKNSEEMIISLRNENRQLRQNIDANNLRMGQCDQEFAHASEQLAALTREVASLNQSKSELLSAETELSILKDNMNRLIRLMEHSPSTKEFFAYWQDSGGLTFTGVDKRDLKYKVIMDTSDLIWHNLSGPGAEYESTSNMFEDAAHGNTELTPTDFAHLKRIYGGDPFPMTADLMEEAEYWVPNDAARLGIHFIQSKLSNTPPKVILDFLRSMNKIWLKRERRAIKRIKVHYNNELKNMKRQLNNARPYTGVLAERQIRRLKSQVIDSRTKYLTGRPRKSIDRDPSTLEVFDEYDVVDFDNKSLPPHQRRLCMVKKAVDSLKTDINQVSAEKLLEASLLSLESMGRTLKKSVNNSTFFDDSLDVNQSISSKKAAYPSESYLKGALWLGKNLIMIFEDLVDLIESFRGKHAADINSAYQDTDARRSAHRLNLLANSGITETLSIVSKSRARAREILQ
eukprot:gene4052-5794_t